jgi:glycosyltransferase involved in cell wall biosynthesis
LPITPEPDFKPLISVLIPVHNDERYIAEALRSVKAQTYHNWEAVVIDDASNDDSWEKIRGEIGGDDRFRGERSTTNKGPGGARNVALARARGEYLVFLDGDDLMMRASLQDRVDALRPHLDDPFVVGSFCGVRLRGEDTALADLADHYSSTQPVFVDFVVAGAEVPFPMTAPLVSAERVRSVGGLDEHMVSGGVDWDLWYRILRNGYVFVASPFQSVVYRQRSGGITRGNPAAHTRAAASLIRAAHRPVEPGILLDPTSFPMSEPLFRYQEVLAIAGRAIRFAAMALADGDHEGMVSTLEVLEPNTWPLIERHLDLSDLVTRGVARSMGKRPTDLLTVSDALEPFVHAVSAAVKETSR